jgi:hypothetical protein
MARIACSQPSNSSRSSRVSMCATERERSSSCGERRRPRCRGSWPWMTGLDPEPRCSAFLEAPGGILLTMLS